MAQTVNYNPKTGAKLTKGQSVVVDGKTYTQGSTNIYGTGGGKQGSTIAPVAKKRTISPSKGSGGGFASATSPVVSTKKVPVNIDKAFASGGLTKDSITTSKSSNTVQYKQPGVLNNIGSFFNNIFGKVGAGSQGGNALQATMLNTRTNPDGSTSSVKLNPSNLVNLPTTQLGKNLAAAGYGGSSSFAPVVGTAPKPKPYVAGNSQNVDLSLGMTGDRPLSGDMVKDSGVTPIQETPAYSGYQAPAGSNNPIEAKTTQVDPLTGAETTVTQQLAAPAPQTNATATANITGLTDSFLKDMNPGNAWDKNQRGEFQDTKIVNYQSTAANMFNSPQEVDNSYNGDSVFRANIDKTAKATNKSPQEVLNGIKAKVQPATNGVVPAQGTAEYLDLINTKNTPKALKAEADLLNRETVMVSQFNSDQDKLAHDILEQTKKDSQAIIDSITRRELSRETTMREKAQFEIDKARAEWEMKDAEVEQNRILAKTNLTEFLAHIGALNTDGASAVGLANLDQKYQAQRQALRSGFELASREIQMNMNSDINELESDLDDNILKINMDLSKSEREVMLDSLKLRNNTNKAILEAQQKYATALRQERQRANDKAQSAANDWTNAYLTISGADMFKSLPAEFRNTWLSNNSISPEGYKTTQVDLAKDFANWNKNQTNSLKLTDTQKLKLSQQGVDVNQYVADPGYREYVDSQLGE